MTPTVVVVVEETDWVGALGTRSISALVLFVSSSAGTLLLWGGLIDGRHLEELLLGLLRLVGKEGDLLLQALNGSHC